MAKLTSQETLPSDWYDLLMVREVGVRGPYTEQNSLVLPQARYTEPGALVITFGLISNGLN